ncbi:peptide chain release factor N(5)-glutamine methyltransferase [bacterium]|nr:peptide chain release factor N(5)-glutamine methyltransferase [bacterium]
MEFEYRKKLRDLLQPELAKLSSTHETSWILDHIEQLKFGSFESCVEKVKEIVARKKSGEPLAYIFGSWNFRGHEVFVNRDTLIPRPETEELVEAAIMSIENSFLSSEKLLKSGFKLADLGSGTGCIGLSTIADFLEDVQTEDLSANEVSKNFELFLVEKSTKACVIIEKNIEAFRPKLFNTKVTLLNEDWNSFKGNDLDVIISNPPYVTKEEFEKLDSSVRDFEPESALLCETSLSTYKEIIEVARASLHEGGWLFMELGISQGESVQEYLSGDPSFNDIRTLKDISKKPRFFCARKSGEL